MNGKTESIVELLNARRPSHTSHVFDDQTAEHSSADDYAPFARGRVGNRPQMMICFRKCTGDVIVFAYSLLTKIRSENPDRGFAMSFHETEVRIEGENLTPLFQYLREHRAAEITEADRTEMLQAKGECVVSKIVIVSSK